MACHDYHSFKHEDGFTLLEVMIAILVTSFALLGLAGLQATGLRFNHSSYLRTIAAQQAYDVTDRMRANIAAVTAGDYNNATPVDTSNCLTVSGCSTSDMAKKDMFDWNAITAARLPTGRGVVCIDSTPNDGIYDSTTGTITNNQCDGIGSLYAVKVWWIDDTSKTPPLSSKFIMSFQP